MVRRGPRRTTRRDRAHRTPRHRPPARTRLPRRQRPRPRRRLPPRGAAGRCRRLLDDEEAVAIAVALRTAAGGLTGIEETALRALAKLEQVLPGRLRGQVTALQTSLAGITWEERGPRADPALLATLAVACRDHEIITFDYTTRQGAATRRRVEPCHLVDSGGLWYLLAHDTDKHDWRLFRLDRTTNTTPTGRRVPPRPVPGGDPAAFVARRLSAAPTRYRAIATIHAPADHVRARTRGLATRLTPIDEHTCRLDASDDHLPRIAQTLAGLDCDYTLDADPETTDHLRTTAHRALHATG